MGSFRSRVPTFVSLALSSFFAISSRCHADLIVFYQPGYSATHFAYAEGLGDGLAIDSSGSVYAPDNSATSNPGIYRFSPSGVGELWSQAAGNSLAVGPDGTGYLATRGLGESILKVTPDGSYSTLVSANGLEWTWTAIGAQNVLYANVWSGPGEGVYSIDGNSGAVAPLVSGGPGENGDGFLLWHGHWFRWEVVRTWERWVRVRPISARLREPISTRIGIARRRFGSNPRAGWGISSRQRLMGMGIRAKYG